MASGTWEARSLVSYKQIGKYGVAAAGIAEIVVDISQEMPSRAVIKGASLRVVCNLRPAGLINPGQIYDMSPGGWLMIKVPQFTKELGGRHGQSRDGSPTPDEG